MYQQVRLQLNADTAAGDWATRPAGRARTGTLGGAMGTTARAIVQVSELRGSIEAMRRGRCCAGIAATSTNHAPLTFGRPAGYSGVRFVID